MTREQLEKLIEEKAEKDAKMLRPQDNPQAMRNREFVAGARSMLPLIEGLSGALGYYANGRHFRVTDGTGYMGADETMATEFGHKARQALKQFGVEES